METSILKSETIKEVRKRPYSSSRCIQRIPPYGKLLQEYRDESYEISWFNPDFEDHISLDTDYDVVDFNNILENVIHNGIEYAVGNVVHDCIKKQHRIEIEDLPSKKESDLFQVDFSPFKKYIYEKFTEEDLDIVISMFYWNACKNIYAYNNIRKYMILELKYIFFLRALVKKYSLFDLSMIELIQSFLSDEDYLLPLDSFGDTKFRGKKGETYIHIVNDIDTCKNLKKRTTICCMCNRNQRDDDIGKDADGDILCTQHKNFAIGDWEEIKDSD